MHVPTRARHGRGCTFATPVLLLTERPDAVRLAFVEIVCVLLFDDSVCPADLRVAEASADLSVVQSSRHGVQHVAVVAVGPLERVVQTAVVAVRVPPVLFLGLVGPPQVTPLLPRETGGHGFVVVVGVRGVLLRAHLRRLRRVKHFAETVLDRRAEEVACIA